MSFVGAGLFFALFASAVYGQPTFRPEIPKVWDDAALAEWATPVAGLNLRPKHMSASEYYALKVENLRTYPVYAPGREPEGYWKKLQELGPQPLIDTRELKTEADWISAGKRVFDEIDFLHLRTLDPKYINEARNAPQGRVLADGTIFGARWVPTNTGCCTHVFELQFLPHDVPAGWDAGSRRPFPDDRRLGPAKLEPLRAYSHACKWRKAF